MRELLVAATIYAVFIAGTGLFAQRGSIRLMPPTTHGVKLDRPWRLSGCNTRISGVVIDSNRAPASHEMVRLRNLVTGVVLQEVETNENGEFQFDVDGDQTHGVEFVVDGQVLALSNSRRAAPCETTPALVMLSGRWDPRSRRMILSQRMNGLLGASAQSSMAAGTVRRAIAMHITPIDAGEPVSASAHR